MLASFESEQGYSIYHFHLVGVVPSQSRGNTSALRLEQPKDHPKLQALNADRHPCHIVLGLLLVYTRHWEIIFDRSGRALNQCAQTAEFLHFRFRVLFFLLVILSFLFFRIHNNTSSKKSPPLDYDKNIRTMQVEI